MASQPLIDLDAFDLSRTVVTKDEVLQTLRQRGRFEMVDGLLHFDPAGDLVVGYKEIRSGDWWCDDHIPGRPLFPGVMMLESAAQICTYDFMHRPEANPEAFVGFGGMNHTRFRGTVVPDCRLVIVGKLERIRSRMFTYSAQGFVEKKMVFETEVLGVVV